MTVYFASDLSINALKKYYQATLRGLMEKVNSFHDSPIAYSINLNVNEMS
jgi:hypothetical protein